MLNVAETFHSIQGEGFWTGTPMHFIRLAGCPVGGKATSKWHAEHSGPGNLLPILSTGRVGSKCQTWDGRFFDCDTDFTVKDHRSVQSLIHDTWEKHICLTGGEPLVHQRQLISDGLFAEAHIAGIQIHIEASGTINLVPGLIEDRRQWITVAPKWQYTEEMIMRADEIKFLVDKDFEVRKVCEVLQWASKSTKVYLCPINGEKDVNHDNVMRVLLLLKNDPTWSLSCQWHKFLGLR